MENDRDLDSHCVMDGDRVNPEKTGQERRGVRQGGARRNSTALWDKPAENITGGG